MILRAYGLQPEREDKSEEFVFGNNRAEQSQCNWIYPVGVAGKFRGLLNQASVAPNCPSLLSKYMLWKWKANVNFGRQRTEIDTFNHHEKFQDGTPVMNLIDFGRI